LADGKKSFPFQLFRFTDVKQLSQSVGLGEQILVARRLDPTVEYRDELQAAE
jgi:hypothetical protein